MNNIAIVILGMHRSGTSAFGGSLSRLGIDFGPEEKMIGAQSDVNARGFWEHREIVMLNETLLTILDSSWDDIFPIDNCLFDSPDVIEVKEKIISILQRDFSDSKIWGLKDPRMCRLLPLWNDIFREINVMPHYIIAYRHPIEVAKSLSKRDGLSIEKANILWMVHVLSSENYSSGYRRTFVSYGSLIEQPKATLNKIIRDFHLPIDIDKEAETNISSFLDSSLRHMKEPPKLPDSEKISWTQQIYEALEHYSSESDSPNDIIELIRGHFTYSLSLFGPLIVNQNTLWGEAKKSRQEISNRTVAHDQTIQAYDHTIHAYDQTRHAYDQTRQAYDQTRQALWDEVKRSRQEISKRTVAHDQTIQAYDQIEEAYEQTKEAYEQTKEAYEQANEAYEQANEAYEQTNEAYEQTKEAYEQANDAFERANRELRSIKKKFSWRVCNKLGL